MHLWIIDLSPFFHWKFSSRFLLYDECNFLCILASQKCFDYCCSGCCCCWPAWGPFIYYVSTWKGGGVKKLSLLLIFRTIKYAYIGGVKSLLLTEESQTTRSFFQIMQMLTHNITNTLLSLLRIPIFCHFGSTSFVLPIRPKDSIINRDRRVLLSL